MECVLVGMTVVAHGVSKLIEVFVLVTADIRLNPRSLHQLIQKRQNIFHQADEYKAKDVVLKEPVSEEREPQGDNPDDDNEAEYDAREELKATLEKVFIFS